MSPNDRCGDKDNEKDGNDTDDDNDDEGDDDKDDISLSPCVGGGNDEDGNGNLSLESQHDTSYQITSTVCATDDMAFSYASTCKRGNRGG